MPFLDPLRPRSWSIPKTPSGVEATAELYLGSGSVGLEVLCIHAFDHGVSSDLSSAQRIGSTNQRPQPHAR